jgi:hypothetical protein
MVDHGAVRDSLTHSDGDVEAIPYTDGQSTEVANAVVHGVSHVYANANEHLHTDTDAQYSYSYRHAGNWVRRAFGRL